jgi:hypothetical protein
MLSRNVFALTGASALALALSGCGGSNGGVAAISATPVAPTPAGMAAVAIFPNTTVSTDFAAIGQEAPHASTAPTITSGGVSVHYDALSGLYVMGFPAAPAAAFYQFTDVTQNATWWYGDTQEPSGNAPAVLNVLKLSNPLLQLTYSTLASYDTGGMGGGSFGWMAFGTATTAGGVPKSGSASYTALVRGQSIDEAASIDGSASFLFDFTAGKLSGHLDPTYHSAGGIGEGYSLGRYDFVNTVYSSGGTSFSGQLSNPGFASNGTFDGQFTGPNAQELMSIWSAPFHDPLRNIDSQMFGALVGKQQ